MGKIVVGTRGASFDEFIEDGISGILVETGNPVELCRAMQRVWNMSNEERENIGKAAQERILLLNPDLMCSNLEGYFLRVIGSRENVDTDERMFLVGEKSRDIPDK